jgi:hypothetical protein
MAITLAHLDTFSYIGSFSGAQFSMSQRPPEPASGQSVGKGARSFGSPGSLQSAGAVSKTVVRALRDVFCRLSIR